MKKNYEHLSINKISQDLNLSRSTVSKVINNKSGVSSKTQQLISEYIHSAKANAAPVNTAKTILFSYRLENIEYINGLLSGIEEALKKSGYLLAINIVNSKHRPYFPASLYDGSISGIISFNIYDSDYYDEVKSLQIPAVFLDAYYQENLLPFQADVILPENHSAIHEAITHLYKQGRRKFGFLGYPQYCYSLFQRWLTFKNTLKELNLPFLEDYSILDDLDASPELDVTQFLKKVLQHKLVLPDVYICASDKQAIQLYSALKELNLLIPEDIAVIGFDNLPESMRQDPPLSTVDAHSDIQGSLAVKLLLDRIENPDRPSVILQCQTDLILRESTN